MPSCSVSYPTDIKMWYQYVTIHYSIHEIYVHPYYFFRPESNDSKGFSDGNYINTTKHKFPEKYSTILSEWVNKIYNFLTNNKISPK